MEPPTVVPCQRPSVERNASFGHPWNLIDIPKHLRRSLQRKTLHWTTSWTVATFDSTLISPLISPIMQRSEEEPVQESRWWPSPLVLHHRSHSKVGVLQHRAVWKQAQLTGASYQSITGCSFSIYFSIYFSGNRFIHLQANRLAQMSGRKWVTMCFVSFHKIVRLVMEQVTGVPHPLLLWEWPAKHGVLWPPISMPVLPLKRIQTRV